MDLRQLRYFIAIIEHSSISRAAQHLHVAQPALSQHLRNMEADLGVALLHRGPRGVQPTEAGERLLAHARTITDLFERIPDQVRGLDRPLAGEVRLGLPGTVSEQLSADLISVARTRFPLVRIRIAEAMSGYIVDWLRRGLVDIAFIYGTADSRGLDTHHLLTEELCLFARHEAGAPSASGVVTLAEAASRDLILPGPGHGLRDAIEQGARRGGCQITPLIEIDAYGQIKALVARGMGYAILPRMAVQPEVEAGLFRAWRIAEPDLTRDVHLAVSTERPLSAASRAIGLLAWQLLSQKVDEGRWVADLAASGALPMI